MSTWQIDFGELWIELPDSITTEEQAVKALATGYVDYRRVDQEEGCELVWAGEVDVHLKTNTYPVNLTAMLLPEGHDDDLKIAAIEMENLDPSSE